MEPKPKKKNLDDKNRRLAESAILAALGLLFILIGNYLPVVSLLLFLSAVPVVVITYRNGLSMGAMSGLIMALLLSVLIHPEFSVTMYMIFFIPGAIMGYGMQRNQDPFQNIFRGFLVMIVAITIYMQILNLFFSFDIMEQLKISVEEYMNFQKEYLQGMPVDPVALLSMMRMLLPAFLVMAAIVISFMNYYASASLMRRLGEKRKLGMLMEFSLPGNVPVGLLLVYLVVYIMYSMNSPYYESIKSSAIAVFGLLFFLQGIAVVAYFIHYLKVSGTMKMVVWGAIILLAPVSGVISAIGLIDTAFNFRRIGRR